MATPLQTAENAAGGIQRVRYTHDAMIDLIIARPGVSQNELGKHFEMSPGWISRVINSDAFQARLAERKTEIVDPMLIGSLEEKLKGAADLSLQRLVAKMESKPIEVAGDMELELLSVSTKALGMGARDRGAGNGTNIQFVVTLPAKVASQEDWVAAHSKGAAAVVDVTPKETTNG